MEKLIRLLAVAAVIAVGILAWRWFFPSPERAIRARLSSLADTVSFKPEDGTVPRALKAQKVPDYFTPGVEISLEPRGFASQRFNGRDEIREAALASIRFFRGLKVELLDINVKVNPDKETAVANLTGKATLTGETDFHVMELNFHLKKVDGKWLIHRIETVKTLAVRRAVGHAAMTSRLAPA